jgi:hypothetical protein
VKSNMTNHKRRSQAPDWSPEGSGRLASATAILDAVGRHMLPLSVDESAMIRGINLSVRWYHEARTFSTNKSIEDQHRRRVMMYKKAKALQFLLEKDDSWLPIGAPPTVGDAFRLSIKRMIEAIDHGIKCDTEPDGASKAYQDSFKIRSPFEWLVGYYLPDVFTLLNVAPVTDQKNFLSRRGTYIRFVQSILAELRIGVDGHPYSLDTVVRAARSRFDGRARRKRGTATDFSFWRNALLRKEMGLPPGPIPKDPQPGFYMVRREERRAPEDQQQTVLDSPRNQNGDREGEHPLIRVASRPPDSRP